MWYTCINNLCENLSETPFQSFWLFVHSVEFFGFMFVKDQLSPFYRAYSPTLHNKTETLTSRKQDKTLSPCLPASQLLFFLTGKE